MIPPNFYFVISAHSPHANHYGNVMIQGSMSLAEAEKQALELAAREPGNRFYVYRAVPGDSVIVPAHPGVWDRAGD